MIRNIDGSGEKFLGDLERIRASGEQAQRRISSGRRIERPSDAPDEIMRVVQLRAEVRRNEQIQMNLAQIKSEVDTADSAMHNAIKVIERATVLAAKGANTLATAEERRQMSQEALGLLQELVGLSRTSVAGRFVFSGDQDELPAYELDLNSPTGVRRLLQPTATRQAQDVSGVPFTYSRTAQDLFDHRNGGDTVAPDNAFAAVNGLRVALAANDQAGIDSALSALKQSADYLNGQLVYFGGAQNRVEEALDRASRFLVQQKGDLSAREDADIAAAILELNRSRTHEEAALSARAKLPRQSLLDYLA